MFIQVNLDMTDSMGPGKLVRHMQNPSYTYDTYLICMGQGPSILSVIDKSLSYSGPSYPSSPEHTHSSAPKIFVWMENSNVLSPKKLKRLPNSSQTDYRHARCL